MAERLSQRDRRRIAALAVGVVVALFAPFLGAPFEYDDKVEILANRVLRHPGNLGERAVTAHLLQLPAEIPERPGGLAPRLCSGVLEQLGGERHAREGVRDGAAGHPAGLAGC